MKKKNTNEVPKNKVWVTYEEPELNNEKITLSFPCMKDAEVFLNGKNINLNTVIFTNTYPMKHKPNKDQLENMLYMHGKVVELVKNEEEVCV